MPKSTRALSHIEELVIAHIRAKARNLRGLAFAQARQALREVAAEIQQAKQRRAKKPARGHTGVYTAMRLRAEQHTLRGHFRPAAAEGSR